MNGKVDTHVTSKIVNTDDKDHVKFLLNTKMKRRTKNEPRLAGA